MYFILSLFFALFYVQVAFAHRQRISKSARCGPSFGDLTCKGSRFGNCCSQYSWCGSSNDYCGQGCLVGYGDCKGSPASSSKPSSTARAASSTIPVVHLPVSKNARCGYLYDASPGGRTCSGSSFGNCCSQYSYCGSTDAYCGKGCQPEFSRGGSCKNIPGKSSISSHSPSVSTRAASSTVSQSSLSVRASSSRPSSSTTSGRPLASSSSTHQSSTTLLRSESTTIIPTTGSSLSLSTKQSSDASTTAGLPTSSIASSASTVNSQSSVSQSAASSASSSNPASSSILSTILVSQTSTAVSSTASSIQVTSSSSSNGNVQVVSSASSDSTWVSIARSPSSTSTELQTSSSLASSSIQSVSSTAVSVSSISSETQGTSSSLALSSSSSNQLTSSVASVISSSTEAQTTLVSSSSASGTGPSLLSTSSATSLSLASTGLQTTAISSRLNTESTSSVGTLISSSSLIESQITISSSSASMTSMTLPSASSSTSSSELQTTIVSSSFSIESLSPTPTSSWTLTSESSSNTLNVYTTLSTSTISLLPSAVSATIDSSTSVGTSSTVASSSSAANCIPLPSPTCNRARDCPDSTNYVPGSASWPPGGLSVPLTQNGGIPTQNLTVATNDLVVGTEYVLTFYARATTLGSGSNGCCNMTAYMDGVPISQYCVGFYWWTSHDRTGKYSGIYDLPRSPSVVYRATVPNPRLQFAVICPKSDYSILVSGSVLGAVDLVPRCNCQEQDKILSIKTQPNNHALNGNFANFDEEQLSPIVGWTSQENWKNQVTPVQNAGAGVADDTSNNQSVVLEGPQASIYQTVSNLDPGAQYNVSILWADSASNADCSLVVKFEDQIVLQLTRNMPAARQQPMRRNWMVFYPGASSGRLWVGSVCGNDFNGLRASNYYPSVRIDDVRFEGVNLKNDAYCGSPSA